ncbi:MAG: hypothetical protein U1F10_07735 [Burkholderiales bacterium]
MPLLGRAAMLLSFDVVAETIADHDAWHTHEHLPERLAIPGFLRGTRWVARAGAPRYFVLYEVAELATLSSAAYLARLNAPSAWTSRVMPSYRGMARGFCTVTGSFGLGVGGAGRLWRFRPRAGGESALRAALLATLPALAARPGLGGAHLFAAAAQPAMTNEQRIRGADADVGWAVFVTGYDADALAGLRDADLGGRAFADAGVTGVQDATYALAWSLAAPEVHAD